MVEQGTHNPLVVGSNPTGPTMKADMSRQRTDRSRDSRLRQRRMMLLVAAVATGLALVVGGAFAWGEVRSAPASRKAPMPRLSLARIESELTTATTMQASATANNRIQVPAVTGKPVEEAEILLAAAGLSVERRETAQVVSAGTAIVVVSQTPEAGEVVDQGTVVVLRVPAVAMTTALTTAQYVVCIDPGHQTKSDLKPEPIGPGATQTKGRVMGGTTGTSTKLPEYEVVLQIATNLKTRLEAAGVAVVMTRTTNDVSLSNSERAIIANNAKADLFIRIHCDGSTDSAASGISTLYPGKTQWSSKIAAPSKSAAESVQASVVAATGAVSRGVVARTDQTGFNWAEVPAITVECGFMTNSVEDKLLASPHYQDKLSEGMTNGIMAFLRGN